MYPEEALLQVDLGCHMGCHPDLLWVCPAVSRCKNVLVEILLFLNRSVFLG